MNLVRYDFDRPDKFSFENLRSLESILTVFSRNFSTELSTLLRLPTEIDITKVEQLPFNTEYVEKREKDEYVFIVTDLTEDNKIIIQMEVGFLLCVHAKQGGGNFGTIKKVKKNITDYEKITARYLTEEYIFPSLKESFKEIWQFDYSISRIETDSQYAKITIPQDMVAVITFEVLVGNEQTEIQIVIPYLSVESYIDKLNTDNVLTDRKTNTPDEELFFLKEHLLQTEAQFEVELGKLDLSVKDILDLEVNDLLILNKIEEPVHCYFGGVRKFIGRIGAKEGKKAVKILGMVVEEKDIEEKIAKVGEEMRMLEETGRKE